MIILSIMACFIFAALLWLFFAKRARNKRQKEYHLGRKSIRLHHVHGVSETNNLSVSSYHNPQQQENDCTSICINCCPQLFKKTVPITPNRADSRPLTPQQYTNKHQQNHQILHHLEQDNFDGINDGKQEEEEEEDEENMNRYETIHHELQNSQTSYQQLQLPQIQASGPSPSRYLQVPQHAFNNSNTLSPSSNNLQLQLQLQDKASSTMYGSEASQMTQSTQYLHEMAKLQLQYQIQIQQQLQQLQQQTWLKNQQTQQQQQKQNRTLSQQSLPSMPNQTHYLTQSGRILPLPQKHVSQRSINTNNQMDDKKDENINININTNTTTPNNNDNNNVLLSHNSSTSTNTHDEQLHNPPQARFNSNARSGPSSSLSRPEYFEQIQGRINSNAQSGTQQSQSQSQSVSPPRSTNDVLQSRFNSNAQSKSVTSFSSSKHHNNNISSSQHLKPMFNTISNSKSSNTSTLKSSETTNTNTNTMTNTMTNRNKMRNLQSLTLTPCSFNQQQLSPQQRQHLAHQLSIGTAVGFQYPSSYGQSQSIYLNPNGSTPKLPLSPSNNSSQSTRSISNMPKPPIVTIHSPGHTTTISSLSNIYPVNYHQIEASSNYDKSVMMNLSVPIQTMHSNHSNHSNHSSSNKMDYLSPRRKPSKENHHQMKSSGLLSALSELTPTTINSSANSEVDESTNGEQEDNEHDDDEEEEDDTEYSTSNESCTSSEEDDDEEDDDEEEMSKTPQTFIFNKSQKSMDIVQEFINQQNDVENQLNAFMTNDDDENDENEREFENDLEHKYGNSVIMMFPPISKMHLDEDNNDDLSNSDQSTANNYID